MVLRRWLLPALLILPTATVMAPPTADAAAVEQVNEAMVKVKLKTGGKTLEHPGHKGEPGREVMLTFTQGDTVHEVSVVFEQVGDSAKKFDVRVKLYKNGAEVLSGSKTAAAAKWVKVGKGSTAVSVLVNPGQKRSDGIKVKPTKDPIDGLE